MAALRAVGAALGIPLLGAVGWTAYTSRKVRHVVVTDPLVVSSYCRDVAARTRNEGVPCLMCAYEVPVIVPTAGVRDALKHRDMDASLYVLHALLSGFFMRVEVTASAFMERRRLSDAYFCWRSTGRRTLAEERRQAVLNQQPCSQELSYGEWYASLLRVQQQQEQPDKRHREAILTYESESIGVSLEAAADGSRQAVLRLYYVIQPFDGLAKDSTAERVTLWCADKYGKLLTAQTAYAVEHLGI
ncbi:PIF1 helicase-like protein [Trypanosoma grayi]|uniref:PIF1 helicase-like protein n=1 Tax=Trypanosoma grayi TaxID=71804 RepID=UPI0004F416A2|nr:PIF1 helicase-like protein [Trypanosoma grayi]KEG10421.1 PIF1 helicase-like protein [Trypanosoma grayi]